jgi:sugar diacid utilization regulator/GAF domain-containing protein
MALHDTLLISPSDMASLAALPTASLQAGTTTMLKALASLRQATMLGPQAVLATAAPILASLGGCPQAAFIVPSRSSWRVTAGAESGGELSRLVHQLGKDSRDWTGVHPVDSLGLTFIALRPGELALALPVVLDTTSVEASSLQLAAQACEVVLSNAERIHAMEDVVAELSALENVATEILSVREVDQVLLSITRKAITLLEADMSGVFLIEGENLVMRSLMGHRSVETSRLRMKTGQGVAGRVIETGTPCKVDSYLESETITHDFDPLARAENTRSALAAPLKVHGEVIGVLEVWRRRSSLFTDRHVHRLAALANLAAIAIENARLYDHQQESMRKLAKAQDSLARQLHAQKEAGTMQRALIQLVLEGEGLPAIVRTMAAQIGGQVGVFGSDFEPLAVYPRDAATDRMVAKLRRVAQGPSPKAGSLTTVADDDRWITLQPIAAGRDALGWFCLLSEQAPSANVEIAIGEAVLSCALSQLEQRAADQARSEAQDEILWDLLEGSLDHRRAAMARANRLHMDLARPHRVVHALIEEFDEAVKAEGWDTARVERLRRELRGMSQRVLSEHGAGELLSIRGNSLMAVVPCDEPIAVRKLVRALRPEIQRMIPGVNVVWGISAAHENPLDYKTANSEAHIALRAARRMGGDQVGVYDQLGVVRLLLASDEDADLSEFVSEIIGPLIEHDRTHDAVLTTTLRAYFDADCSQQVAAKRLFVHHKTLRYRLDRIEALTSLDLRRHEDRLRADLALKIHEVMEMRDIRL